MNLPGVDWEAIEEIEQYDKSYIDYMGVIEQERLPAIFPSSNVVRESGVMC